MSYVGKVYLFFAFVAIGFFCLGWFLHPKEPKAHIFAPNRVLIKKPIPIEVIENETRLHEVRSNTKIIDAEYSEIGSALRSVHNELILVKKEALLAEYRLRALKSSEKSVQATENFFPQYIASRYPMPMQFLDTKEVVNTVKRDSSIYKHREAEIGAVLSLSLDGRHINLIPKQEVQQFYEAPIELRVYLKRLSYCDKS